MVTLGGNDVPVHKSRDTRIKYPVFTLYFNTIYSAGSVGKITRYRGKVHILCFQQYKVSVNYFNMLLVFWCLLLGLELV